VETKWIESSRLAKEKLAQKSWKGEDEVLLDPDVACPLQTRRHLSSRRTRQTKPIELADYMTGRKLKFGQG
jgi:hypothetical protein